MALKQVLRYASWPAATGSIVALVVILLSPPSGDPRPNAAGTLEATAASTRLLARDQGESSTSVSYAAAVRRAAPAVVSLYGHRQSRNHAGDTAGGRRLSFETPSPQEETPSILGSGVIVSERGYILTNLHVLEGADEVVVQLHDGREAHATNVGSDPDNDLAVLKIERGNLTAITIGTPNQVQVGDIALAIGNPFGIGQSVSQGIISATGRVGNTQQGLKSYLQTDAAINPGNSGGALVDGYGNLLGINTAIVGGQQSGGSVGIGFAIPATVAMSTLEEIIEYVQTHSHAAS